MTDDEPDATDYERLAGQLFAAEAAKLARDHATIAAESFAEYVIGEAGLSVRVDTFDIDAVVECIEALDANGYRVDGRQDEPVSEGLACVHPSLFDDLRSDYERHVRFDGDGDLVPRTVGIHGVDVWPDQSMPEGVGVVLHPDATAPTPPHEVVGLSRHSLTDVHQVETLRPWLVKDPNGVVVVEVRDAE